MLPPPSLAAGRDVGNDDEVLVSTYNAIVPHKESNVNAWFDRLTTGGSASDRFTAALADVFSLDDAAPKCVSRVQDAFDLDLDAAIQVYAGSAMAVNVICQTPP